MNFWTFLLAAASPLVLRAITALGMSVVTFVGVDTALSGLITQAQSNWSGLAADVLGLAAVAQIPACLGLIAGAMTARVSMWVAASAAKWIVK
jgi:hypothetical protein